MIGSDKTNLTRFSGDKMAWPVYITVGNINKETRRKPSENAVVLLGYLPVTKLEAFLASERSEIQHQLFHNGVRTLLEPLIKAGRDGINTLCSDGEIRLVFPILAAYIADHPEQCLVACCKENRCPKCLVPRLERGNPAKSQLRDATETIEVLKAAALQIDDEGKFEEQGLRRVDPFWKKLPRCDIFSTFTPDLLHQLHKGVFGDHVVKWACNTISKPDEIDRRFRTMTKHPSLRHFYKGISLVSQWSGREYKEVEKVFLGVIAGAAGGQVVSAVRAVLDFIYYAHFECHTDSTLKKLEAAWTDFHATKSVFVTLGVRKDFNIPKVHSMQHYVHMIKSRGTTDNFNTELPERLHIIIAKDAFDHSNKRDYIAQMRLRLQRHEAACKFTAYLAWAVEDYVPGGKRGRKPGAFDVSEDVHLGEEPPADLDDSGSPPPGAKLTLIHHDIAKKPPFTMSLDNINSTFKIRWFADTLERFLKTTRPPHPSLRPAIENARYAIFKQFTIKIPSPPQVSSEPFVNDVVRARPGEPGSNMLAKLDLSINDDARIKWWDIKGESHQSGFRQPTNNTHY